MFPSVGSWTHVAFSFFESIRYRQHPISAFGRQCVNSLTVLEGGVPSLQDTYSGALLSREIVCFLNPELLDYRIVIRERKFYIKVIGFIGQMVLLTVN